MKDPSLLGLAYQDVLEVRPLTIGIREQLKVQIQFTLPPIIEEDNLQLTVPLDGERYSLGPVGHLEILVRFKMDRPVRSLFSATHHLSVFRESATRCLVTANVEKKPVRSNFELLATFGGSELDFRLFAHRTPGERGTFLVLVAPPFQPLERKETEKDVVFLLDASGSMDKSMLDLSRKSIIAGLERLRPGDRFNVMILQTGITRFADRLLPVSSDAVGAAVDLVSSVTAGGGTDVYNGLMNALEQFTSRRRPSVIILAGDGRPTVGIVDPRTILDDVLRRNRVRARIFTLATGPQADPAFMDAIATANRGICHRISPKDDVQAIMGNVFAGVAPPLASGLSIDVPGCSSEGIMPDPIPDLTGSEGAALVGRYAAKDHVNSKVLLRAKVKGRMKTVTKTCPFPIQEHGLPAIGPVWGMRQMAKLMEREWLKGPEPEVRHQIAELVREFGFKSPLPQDAPADATQPAPLRREAAGLLWLLKTSFAVPEVTADRVRRVAEKVFFWDKGCWVDNRYQPSMPSRTVFFLSDDYFELLRSDPQLGPILALGPDVAFVWRNTAIRVTSAGIPNE